MNPLRLATLVDRLLQAGRAAAAPLTLDEAGCMAQWAVAGARTLEVPMVFAVVDPEGGLILAQRMDGALPASTELAMNKAFSAAAFRQPTHLLGLQAQPGGPLYGLQSGHQGRVVLFGGGYPVRRGGRVVGAIGVSGGRVDQDMWLAEQVLDSFKTHVGNDPEQGDDHE